MVVIKRYIYLSLSIAIGLVTACRHQSPTAVVSPTPTPTPIVVPTVPTPVASATPTPTVAPTPTPVPTIAVKPTPPTVAAIPKFLYPKPTPVAIPVPTVTVKPTPVQSARPAPTPQPTPDGRLAKLILPATPALQITPTGIGTAKIGMSFKELKQQLGAGYEFPVKTAFIVDFDAIAVTKAGTVQYYIPYPAGTNFGDDDRIEHLITDNPNYRTATGVGPGTPIDRAATVYGSATLSLSKEDESREFINFTKHPDGLAFRPKPLKTRTFAGNYPESNEDYLKTQKYDPQAAIGSIVVSCSEQQCESEHGDH